MFTLQTINESRIRAALKATGETMTEERLHTLVCLELDKEKQIYESEFSQKVGGLILLHQLPIT